MNCKPDDLAVFIRSHAGNEGKIVRCIRLLEAHEIVSGGFNPLDGPVWETDTPVNNTLWGFACRAHDSNLRPIRDHGEDARDETLEWLPVPSKEKETA